MIISCKGGDGMFITFEGIDGCGKSTQALFLYEAIKERREVVLTKEPGGWDGGSSLRELVLGGGLKHRWSEAFLFMLDRAEHVAKVVQPAMAAGKTVICERYQDSTLAYQAWGRGMPFEALSGMARAACFPVPDVTLLFDIEPELALKRVAERGRPDAFENEGLRFMAKIREGYLSLAAMEPERWAVIECGTHSPEMVFAAVKSALTAKGAIL